MTPEFKENIRKHESLTLREVFESSKNIPIEEGGLYIILEKIVKEIEVIKHKVGVVG